MRDFSFAYIALDCYGRDMNRPPPYFPQNQLSPPDENRYRKFKLVIGAIIFVATLLLIGLGIGAYYLISWMISG